jgi:holo-[acyl-carrier protein] synthase
MPASPGTTDPAPLPRTVVGIDLVRIARIVESLDSFGERFMRRLFTAQEIAWALASPACTAERLAARFAAKEAAIKAFDLAATGVDWRDIEVVRLPSGATRLALHGAVARHVAGLGIAEAAVSLSHADDYAAAVVTALRPACAVPDHELSL